MTTYRATVTLDLEVTASAALTEDEVRQAVIDSIKARIGWETDSRVLEISVANPIVTIHEAWCAAVVRRNSIDGHLYACQMAPGAAEHGSVEACSKLQGLPCDRPEEHHAYVSPGFDSPVEPAAPASSAT